MIKINLFLGKKCSNCDQDPPKDHIVITWTTSETGWYSAYCDRYCLREAMTKDTNRGLE